MHDLPHATHCAMVRLHRPVLALLVLVLLAPFFRKAFNVDDPLFIWAAQHIRKHPLDPYHLTVNWIGVPQRMSLVTQNPPLHAYYLALVSSYGGTSEVALHLAMVLPAVVCVLAVHELARRMGVQPVAAAVCVLVMPMFLISAATVMCDVPLLALWCLACAFWLRGIEGPHHAWLAAAAVCAGLASWTKYFGICCVPLLLVYGLSRRRSVGLWVLWLAIPLAMLWAWSLWSRHLYGVSHVTQALRFSHSERVRLKADAVPLAYPLAMLSFTGGGLLVPLLLSWTMTCWQRPVLLAGLLTGLLLALTPVLGVPQWPEQPSWLQQGEFWLFVWGGVLTLVQAARHVVRRRDARAMFLAAWIGGTFAFGTLCNWTVAGRTVLPMAPAVALLFARESRWGTEGRPLRRASFVLPVAITGAVTMALMCVDARWAASSRAAAEDFATRYRADGRRLWFMGHWGLQYYLEQLGAQAVYLPEVRIAPEDWVLVPENNADMGRIDPRRVVRLEHREYEQLPWIALMRPEVGAGFYSNLGGPLPFGFGRVRPESYDLFAPQLQNDDLQAP